MRLYLDLCTSSYFALEDGAGKVVSAEVHAPPLRNEEALGAVEGLLRRAGFGLNDLTAIAVASGPGSFTGIRVGLAMAQGLAFTRDLPLFAFPTLGALQAAYPDRVAALPAQGGRWYMRLPQSETDRLLSETEAQATIRGFGGAATVTGELPKTWQERPLFAIEARLEEATPWPKLCAYAFAQPQAPLRMVSPHYVQASAADAKRRRSESEPLYRPWREGDIPVVALLEADCNADAWSESGLQASHRSEGSLGFVVELDGEVVGYCLLHSVLDEAELQLLGVAPVRRRQGLALALVRHARQVLAGLGIERIHLEVRVGNAPARALYARLGFREVGLRKGYYAARGAFPCEDAVLMAIA
jgi:[ribosomal protein S18]-alanine N-acetyltransferase